MDANATQMGGPIPDPNRTVMGGPEVDRTVTIKPVQCPVCKTMNAPGHWFCVECGLIFAKELDGDAFGAPAVQLPSLVDATGRSHTLRPGRQTLGRAGDILIEDNRVSRIHAGITLDAGVVTVEDLGSTNGTQVAGEPAPPRSPVPFPSGATLSLGGFELRLVFPGEATKTQMPVGGQTRAMAAAPGQIEAVAKLVCGETVFSIAPGEYTIGRRDTCDFTVPDGFASGNHGKIEADETGIYYTDTGSTNGSAVNGTRLEPNVRTKLEMGDTVRLGNTDLRLES